MPFQGTFDRFHSIYFNQTGDITVTCLIKSFRGMQTWRKRGITFCQNLGPLSAYIMVNVTG